MKYSIAAWRDKKGNAPDVRALLLIGGTLLGGSCTKDQSTLFEGGDNRATIGAACVTDKQCSDQGLLCDALSGCVECRTTSDCTSGKDCVSGRCEVAVHCQDSRACGGRVCAASAGVCVDCAVDADCLPGGQRCVSAVCTAQTKPAAPSGGTGGQAGRIGSGGTKSNSGGTSPTGGLRGDAGVAGPSGSVAGGPNGGASSGGTTGDGGFDAGGAGGESGSPDSPQCDAVSLITAVRATPSVALAVEGSAVMFEAGSRGWDLLYDTLMDSDVGIVRKYEQRIRFGFSVYSGRSPVALSESDPACADISSVAYAMGNHAAIDLVSSRLDEAYSSDGNWSAPTGHAFDRISMQLAASNVSNPKYVILMLSSDPNTCGVPTVQCGQDQAIAAVQAAYTNGIRTLVVGTADIARSCEDSSRRCGLHHLADLANAGVGLPVQAPPAAYWSLPCSTGGIAKSKFADLGTTPGQATHHIGSGADALRATLSRVIENVVDCSFDLNVFVQDVPATGQVILGSTELQLEGPNGYRLEANRRQITLTGSACTNAHAGQPLRVAFPCVTVTP